MESIVLSGYSATKKFGAQRVTRGGKTVYILSLPIHLVPIHLPVPNPDQPIDSNRAVRKSHAEDFGQYWLKYPDSWTVPPLLVDTAHHLIFDQKSFIEDGPGFGTLEIPDYSARVLRTLDGQHRILGWDLIRTKLLSELAVFQEQLLSANRSGTDLEKDVARKKVAELKAQLQRMNDEQVTIEIITGVSEAEHKNFFITIADYAIGINSSERTRMDEVNKTSRIAKKLIDDIPLLTNRVEMRKSAAGKNSKDLLSVANLRDIVRHLCFSIKGKVTLAREQKLDEGHAFDIAQRFFSAMSEGIPSLKGIADGLYLPRTMRAESLLGSSTFWRSLAGAYHELAVVVKDQVDLTFNPEGHQLFVKMLPNLVKVARIKSNASGRTIDGRWYATGCFSTGEIAPRSRAQDLNNLSLLLAEWARTGEVFNPAKPKKSSR
jgi:hypothetical protein